MFPDRRETEDDRGLRLLLRPVHRSDLRPETLPGHSIAFNAALHRRLGFTEGRLRLWLRLRVLLHGFLGRRDYSAADGTKSAGDFRAVVRRRRYIEGARRTAMGGTQRPRSDQPI